MRKTILIPALVAISSLVCSTDADGRIWFSGSHSAASYELRIVVNGVEQPVYYQGGYGYVEGFIGSRYAIRVHNRSWRRVEAVISVDGRDAIDGRPAELGKRGYVIPPYSFIDVDGFRISTAEVAAFRFTTVPDSYASRMGTPWEVGVIGVAVFPERVNYPPPPPPYALKRGEYPVDDAERQAPRAGATAESAPYPYPRGRDLGTQFGERSYSPVSETTFVRENWSSPEVRLGVRYNSRQGLCAMGVRAFCDRPWPPPPPPPYYPDPPYSEPPPGWDHFGSWY